MTEVVLGALVAWLWLGETLTAVQLVLVGVALAQTAR
jgi:drug/metabolite transporter (DMT)-like permease